MTFQRNKFLIFLVLLGASLRFLNLNFGSPSLYISNDEAAMHISAYRMMSDKTIMSTSYYTPFGAYVQIPFIIISYAYLKATGVIANINELRELIVANEGYLLFIPRFLSATFGTLSIILMYKLTKTLFQSRKIALMSAILTVFSFNLVHMSHFARPWPESMFFSLLTLHFSLRRNFLMAFLSAVFSYGFLQVGIFIFPLIFLFFEKKYSKQFIVGFFFSLISILILSKLTAKSGAEDLLLKLRPDSFVTAAYRNEADILTKIINNFKYPHLFFTVKSFARTDLIIFTFGVLSILKLNTLNIKAKKVFFYITAYFTFALFFLYPVLHYYNLIIFLLIPFASYSTWHFIQAPILLKRRLLSFFILVLILFISAYNSFWWNYVFLKDPTFIEARNWIIKNTDAKEPIAYIGGRYSTFSPSKEAIFQMQKFQPNMYREAARIGGDFPNVRNIIYTRSAAGGTKMEKLMASIKDYPVSYVVDYYYYPKESLYSFNPNRFTKIRSFSPLKKGALDQAIPEALYEAASNFENFDHEKTLSMYSLSRTGPYFDILKIKD